jgi:hypothetical protein
MLLPQIDKENAAPADPDELLLIVAPKHRPEGRAFDGTSLSMPGSSRSL